jgi:hypothetical protein
VTVASRLNRARNRDSDRLAASFAAFEEALDDDDLDTPPPVTDDVYQPVRGKRPVMPLEAYELARQVYYDQHGNLGDAAKAVLAAGLQGPLEAGYCDELTTVRERLHTWWKTRDWPVRPWGRVIAMRDAVTGGLYRGRQCTARTTGNGPSPAGFECRQSALADSDFCYQHDPRPEWVEKRRRQAESFAEARLADLVDIGPFVRFCEAERKRLLSEARARGKAHPNNRGYGRLAAAMGIDPSVLGRLLKGTTTSRPEQVSKGKIRALTVVRYLEPLGVQFRDVYGFDPPLRTSFEEYDDCPGCGRQKRRESGLCRDCYDVQGQRCAYVKQMTGKQCNKRTTHPSGYCATCRQIVEHVPTPRTGRPSFLTVPLLILALSEFRDVPSFQWVAARMWQYNAGGVRHVFASQKTLNGSLVKQFAKRGWKTAQDAERAHDELVTEHGPVEFPDEPVDDLFGDVALVPLGQFLAWLEERYAEVGSYKRLGELTGCNPDNVSKWLRGVGVGTDKATVRRDTVERALAAFPDGPTFADLYGRRA